MINHAEIHSRLAAYCGGDLDASESIKVAEHLAECHLCRSELADLQTSMRHIRSTPEVDPPQWLTTRIMARLQEQQGEKRNWFQRLFFPLHLKLPLELMALFVVCISGYYLSQTVETNLEQSAQQKSQETPVQQQIPMPQQPKAKESVAEEKSIAPQTKYDKTSPHEEARQPALMATPAYAPPPSAIRNEEKVLHESSAKNYAAPAAKSDAAGYSTETTSPSKQIIRRSERLNSTDVQSAPAAMNSLKTSKTMRPPTANIRMQMTEPAAAREAVRLAAVKCGGLAADNSSRATNERQITISLQKHRLPEFMSHLEKLGKIIEQPTVKEISGTIEVVISW
jgi:hypothetical protein